MSFLLSVTRSRSLIFLAHRIFNYLFSHAGMYVDVLIRMRIWNNILNCVTDLTECYSRNYYLLSTSKDEKV